MITTFDKAIAAVIVPLAVFLLAKVGFNADPDFAAELATLITGLAVYLVPNKAPTA